jgi:hypothetical protein
MSTRTRSLLSVVALALLTTSCLNDPVEPRVTHECLECLNPFPIAFEAVSANDHPLPAFIDVDGSTQSGRQLTSASMLLFAPDSLRLILASRQVAANGEIGAEVRDTLRAHFRRQDSTAVLSPMGTYPLLLQEQVAFGRDGSMAVTVEEQLPSSQGAVGSPAVTLVFRRTAFSGPDQH